MLALHTAERRGRRSLRITRTFPVDRRAGILACRKASPVQGARVAGGDLCRQAEAPLASPARGGAERMRSGGVVKAENDAVSTITTPQSCVPHDSSPYTGEPSEREAEGAVESFF